MEVTGSIAGLTIDYISGRPKLTLSINERQSVCRYYDQLKERKLSIVIKPYKEKRSLDANAYCWVLIGKIAESIHASKDEVYRTI